MHLLRVLATKECQHCQILNNNLYKSLSGKSYSYVFDNGIVVDRNGAHCHMRGHFNALIPFGLAPHQDIEAVKSEGKLMLSWGESIGLTEPGSKIWKSIQQLSPEYCNAIICPGIPLKKARLGTMVNFFYFVFDDILDNLHYEERDAPYTYTELANDVEVILVYLNEEKGEEALSAVPKKGRALPRLHSFATAMRDIRKLALETSADPKYFFKGFSAYARFCALESAEQSEISNQIEYLHTINHCKGLAATMELLFIIRGLSPTKAMRSDPMFALFFHLAGQHTALVNDLLSLKKEVRQNEKRNLVIVRSNADGGCRMTMQEAFDKTVHETNSVALRTLELKGRLLELYPGNEVLAACLEVGLNFANSHLNMYVDCERYGNNPIYFGFEHDLAE